MFDNSIYAKLNDIADWIIRVVMLNLMMILFSLPVITIYPAFSAGYNMFIDYVEKKNTRLFRDYFRYFKESLGQKTVFSVVIILSYLLAYLNIRYYHEYLKAGPNLFYTIGYYVSLALMAMWTATVFYSIVVYKVKPKLALMDLLKISFYMAGKFFWVTMLLVIIALSPALLILFLSPFTSMVFIIAGVSLPMLLAAVVTRQSVNYLRELSHQND